MLAVLFLLWGIKGSTVDAAVASAEAIALAPVAPWEEA